MGRATIRKSGKPLSDAERCRRYRANKKARLKAEKEAERRARRIEVNGELGIRPLAIAGIGEVELASASVDAVITDPPYAEVDLPLYGELAQLAMRVLKPGGWCLAMRGALFLDRILASMIASGLAYRDEIAISLPGGHHSRVGTMRTFAAAKFMLVLQKPPVRQPPQWGPNLIAAAKNGHDKSRHSWQQNQEVFEKLIERFTLPGDLVVDPFAGSGTTLRAALALGRRAWGSDIDAAGPAEPVDGHGEVAARGRVPGEAEVGLQRRLRGLYEARKGKRG
jgi:site-specific DNA-methyltransferase (adenine-specific)